MKTIEEIRLANLSILRSEFPSERQFAIKLNKSPNQVNQWFGKGAARSIGSDAAREVEEILGRPRGWLDNDQSQPARLSGSIILAAYREAVAKFEHATGLNETSFQPFKDEDDAALLASCIEGQLSADGGITGQWVNKNGSAGSNRVGSGIAGKDRAPEAGGESAPARRQRKKSAA